jgi:hypothetical protein
VIGDPKGQQSVDNWFNVSAFSLGPSGTFGNAGRNTIRGPGWITFDTSVQRRIAVAGRLGATLRWVVFNLFNRANFGLPDANIASTTVSTITTLAGDPRIMQFSVRIDF